MKITTMAQCTIKIIHQSDVSKVTLAKIVSNCSIFGILQTTSMTYSVQILMYTTFYSKIRKAKMRYKL